MNANEYQQRALRTEAPPQAILDRLNRLGIQAMRLTTASLGLSSDAGEVASLTQKLVEYGKDVDLIQLKEEVGDCLWRLAQVCDAAGFTLSEAMEANLRKLMTRYKDGYSDQAANNRDKEAEARAMINAERLEQYERDKGYPSGSLTTKYEPPTVEQDGHGFGHMGPSEFLGPTSLRSIEDPKLGERFLDQVILDDDPKPKDY